MIDDLSVETMSGLALGSIAREQDEVSRFNHLVEKHLLTKGRDSKPQRIVLQQYCAFSPNSSELIDDLITACVESVCDDNLDTAIDVLSGLGRHIFKYAEDFLHNDLRLYKNESWQPNLEYWYVLISAVCLAEIDEVQKLSFLRLCIGSPERIIAEAVAEGLSEIGSTEALSLLSQMKYSSDDFIAKLAADLLAS